MAEAEDVIVDAARHATSYAMDLWRRNRAPDGGPPGVALADVRPRLELLLEAALGTHVPIRIAAQQPPRTLLSRLFERGRREPSRRAVPAIDGVAIFLPARFESAQPAVAFELYRVAAFVQALRHLRGTARHFPWDAPLAVQDLYLASETAAVCDAFAARVPGLVGALAFVRRTLLGQRPARARLSGQALACEALYQDWLATGVLGNAPYAAAPLQSLEWARERASHLPPGGRYTGLASDALIGTVLRADAAHVGHFPGGLQSADQPARSAALARRPRARDAAEDEDDEETGLFMIQTSQPSEHAEDAMGLKRPVDKEPDGDLQGAGESISELEELRLVSTPRTSREILAGDDELPVRGARVPPPAATAPARLAYPEWDYTIAAYRERAAVVRTLPAIEGSARWVESMLAQHRATLTRVRRRFEALRSRRSVQHGEPEGDDLDLEAFVGAYGDRRARLPRDDRLYVTYRPARRDFALMFLIDVSGSTEAWMGSDKRIIDLEKEALLIVSTALEALRVRFAILAFSGYGPSDVRVRDVKTFDERFDRNLARRVAALEPDEFTRAGAALRHASVTLLREPAHRRLMLMLSDGKPNDCDYYEGRYGFEDARQALAESRLAGIAPFCVTVDRQATRHLSGLFGPGNYTIVRDPQRLSAALLEWLHSVTVAIG